MKSDSLSVSETAWNLGLAAIFLGLLVAATMLHLAEPRRTVGMALAYIFVDISPILLISLIEHCTPPAGPRKSSKRWLLHLQLLFANYASFAPFSILGAAAASFLVAHFGLNLGLIDLRIATKGQTGFLVIALFAGVLVADFFFYWYHRACHRSNILWQHHKMHHMDPAFDALTGPRQNWIETFFITICSTIPIAILFKLDNLDPLKLGLINGSLIGVLRGIILLNHSNLRLQYGWASVLCTSSQTHRIHHSYLPQHLDKNFVAFFPIWDIVFGTYYHPARNEFPPTGVPGEKDIESVWEVQIYALREWYRMYRERRASKELANQR